jgi:hypothetical protein
MHLAVGGSICDRTAAAINLTPNRKQLEEGSLGTNLVKKKRKKLVKVAK